MARSGKSILFRVVRLWCLTSFLFFVVSAANASPTVTVGRQDAILFTSLCSADTSISRTISNVVEPVNVELANLGAEFLQLPAGSLGLSSPRSNPVKPLPAVPAAMLMVLTGFICISLVRDRRVWLSALAGLLWIGQAGIQALPQLALRLSHKNHIRQQSYAELTYPYYLENSSRLRSEVEGTQYIGLLHHLAGIPAGTTSLSRITSFLRKQESRKVTAQLCCRFNSFKNTNSFQSRSAFFSEQYNLNSLFKCLASRAKHFVYFSPAFIFAQLPRGPPNLA